MTPHRLERDERLELIPIYPIGGLTPNSKCPHDGPIPKGSRIYCEVCGKSGMDGLHADLHINKNDPLRRVDGTQGRNHKRPR